MATPTLPSQTYTNIKRINDDLIIGQRSIQQKPTWYLYRIGDRFPQRSLRTTDLKEATKRALDAYRAFLDDPDGNWLGNTGVRTATRTFAQVAAEWLTHETADQTYKQSVIDKFLVPFFQGERNVTDMGIIDDAMIADYKLWRRSYWMMQREQAKLPSKGKSANRVSDKQMAVYDEPSATTLNREYPTLRQILKFAGKRGYMGKSPVPDVPAEAAEVNRRPAFLGGDFDKLMAEAEAWASEETDEPTQWRRQLLCDWIYVNRWTGLRLPHEAEKLAWGHIHLEGRVLHVHPDTKTGKREVPLDQHVVERLEAMRLRRQAHAKRFKQTFSNTECVFALPDGTPFTGFGTLFNKVVARCEFPVPADKMPYSPYSLRHTYATFALAEGKTYAWLEEVMGTSEKMLKAHYKQGTIEQTQRYLREKGLMPDQKAQMAAQQVNANAGTPLEMINLYDLPEDSPWRRTIVLGPANR